MDVDVSAIPEAMKREARWGLWRLEGRNGKPTKVPYSVVTGRPAQSTNPLEWTSFDRAVARCVGSFSGLGFRLGQPWAGVDLDGCRDPETGELAPEAGRIIELMDTYTEVSPSGNGVKLFCLGALPPGRRRGKAPWRVMGGDHADVEMYDMGRYFTVTGDCIWGFDQVRDCTEVLAKVHGGLFAAAAPVGLPQSVSEKSGQAPRDPLEDADAKVIRVAQNARNGPQFNDLWRGGLGTYQSPSEADCALVAMLGFYCGGDVNRVDKLFRQSARYRPKWDEQHGALTYGELTLAKGLSDMKAIYGMGRGR